MKSRFQAIALAAAVAIAAPFNDALADAPTLKVFKTTKADLAAAAKAAGNEKDAKPTGVSADPTVQATSDAAKQAGNTAVNTATDTAVQSVTPPTPAGGIIGIGAKSVFGRGKAGVTGWFSSDAAGAAWVINKAIAETTGPVVVFYGATAEAQRLEKTITDIAGAKATLLIVNTATAVDGKENGAFKKGVDAIIEKANKGVPLMQLFTTDAKKAPVLVANADEATAAILQPLLVAAAPAAAGTNAPAATNAPAPAR